MENQDRTLKLPPPESLLLSSALYEEFYVPDNDEGIRFLAEIVLFDGHLDAYCVDCKQTSVFQFPSPSVNAYPTKEAQFKGFTQKAVMIQQSFSLTGTCSRDKNHKLFFYFLYKKGVLVKIGQHPSIADLDAPDLKKYRKVLSDSSFADLRRAIGLKAHGIGAGSLIYLRRIFENLIEEAHQEAMKADDWDEEQYNKARLEEKILLLGQNLPQTLVEMRFIYGIMSIGIHSLAEEDCLKYFNPIRAGIELVLEEKLGRLQEIEKQRKAQEAKNMLSQINAQIQR